MCKHIVANLIRGIRINQLLEDMKARDALYYRTLLALGPYTVELSLCDDAVDDQQVGKITLLGRRVAVQQFAVEFLAVVYFFGGGVILALEKRF